MSANPTATVAAQPPAAPAERKLTLNDPVDAETLAKFGELQTARSQVAERLLDLRQEEIRTLRAASNIDNERQRLFEGILTSRGLPPNAPVEIDAKTGKVTPINPNGTAAPLQAAPPNGQGSAQA